MTAFLRSKPHFVLAYNGCDEETGEEALASDGPEGLIASTNGYDWLGAGIYFWETDAKRALEWAEDKHAQHSLRQKEKGTPIGIRRPFAVGALINLGTCLDLTTREGVELLQEGYKSFVDDFNKLKKKKPSLRMPVNFPDNRYNYLDYQVINYTCRYYEKNVKQPIDTVRCLFLEGAQVYPGSEFQVKTHTQICVRKPSRAILGYFRVRDMGRA